MIKIKLLFRRWLIRCIYNEYQRALIFEAIQESQSNKCKALGETLQDHAIELYCICDDFNVKYDLYK